MPYLLHQHPMALLTPANPRMECEKNQINNTLQSILDEDVPYLIVVKILPLKKQGICSKRLLCIFLCVFYILYIFNLQYPEELETTLFY